MASRFLYVMRHGAAVDDGDLSAVGREQSRLAGERLKGVPLSAIYHSPKPRAAQTAAIVASCVRPVLVVVSDLLDDYIPSDPDVAELPPAYAQFVGTYTACERAAGAQRARAAVERFGGPADAATDTHDLVVTHNFLVGWFVRDAVGAPDWRWLGLNQQNAALSVIRYQADLPPSLLFFNDAAHLPEAKRWTGFPAALRPACD